MFTPYHSIEVRIFRDIQKYFEALPTVASDDYNNMFFDVVAQYGFGGQNYMGIESSFTNTIESQVDTILGKISSEDKSEIVDFYESNFLENYYYDKAEKFYYTNEDLISQFSNRFKSWIEDSFDADDFLNPDGEEVDEEDEEE